MDNKQDIVAGVRRNWKLVARPRRARPVRRCCCIGGAAGLAWTNTEEFCIGCHEMRDNVYAEYKGTIHDQNRTGVRAICADCHVPHEPGAADHPKMRATWTCVATSPA